MKKTKWEVVKSEAAAKLKLFNARFDYMKNPRNGKTEKMIILESNDSVNVVALTTEQQMIFVRQYRFGIGEETLELPGGIVDEPEPHDLAAQRELREETGYAGDKWTYLGKVASNPVFMDSYIHHWVAIEVSLQFDQQLDDGEAVDLVLVPVEEVKQKLLSGFFQHPHTVTALLLYFGKALNL